MASHRTLPIRTVSSRQSPEESGVYSESQRQVRGELYRRSVASSRILRKALRSFSIRMRESSRNAAVSASRSGARPFNRRVVGNSGALIFAPAVVDLFTVMAPFLRGCPMWMPSVNVEVLCRAWITSADHLRGSKTDYLFYLCAPAHRTCPQRVAAARRTTTPGRAGLPDSEHG